MRYTHDKITFKTKQDYLAKHHTTISNKIVLDLACHDGESTDILQTMGAKHIYAIDIREHLIEEARQHLTGNIDFFVGDVTDSKLICPLIEKSQTVVLLGLFYHLFDHFRFLSHILKPNIEYCLIETLFGTESLNAEMVWGFENTHDDIHGWSQGLKIIPNGTPNLSWIIQAARIFGFECDWVECRGVRLDKDFNYITYEEYMAVVGPNWPPYNDLIMKKQVPKFVQDEIQAMLGEYPHTYRRMVLRLYNTKLIQSQKLAIEDIYRWPL